MNPSLLHAVNYALGIGGIGMGGFVGSFAKRTFELIALSGCLSDSCPTTANDMTVSKTARNARFIVWTPLGFGRILTTRGIHLVFR
jgi:hypothetical protein